MYTTLLVIFLLISTVLIWIIMLQETKYSDIESSFGSGASATLFGSSGLGNFMTRLTAIFAALFFVISLILGNLTSNKTITGTKWENISEPVKVKKLSAKHTNPVRSTSDIPH
ncbi:MAG: preprotein translocase subunit SecG [Arsenophonus sp.]